LAWLLLREGQRIIVCDPGKNNSASRIAAGIVNPILGKRFVKAPSTELYLQEALTLYQQIGEFFRQAFYYKKPMLRLFNDANERTSFFKRIDDSNYQPYIGTSIGPKTNLHGLKLEFGGYQQLNSGFLDCDRFLRTLRAHFSTENSLLSEAIDYDEIAQRKSGIHWHGKRVNRMVCCDGFATNANPWFSWLPFQPSKGEILSLKSETNMPDAIVNKGRWLLALDQQSFKLGATYQWTPLDTVPSQPARDNLLKFYNELFAAPPQASVVQHQAGIRPGTLDKSPFIGAHPECKEIMVFNGFGSTGVLRIPYYAERLKQHLLHASPLPRSANINRYYARYTSG